MNGAETLLERPARHKEPAPHGLPLAVICGLTSLEGEVTTRQFVELIERMITVDRKLAPGQLAELHQQRQRLLPDDFPEAGAG